MSTSGAAGKKYEKSQSTAVQKQQPEERAAHNSCRERFRAAAEEESQAKGRQRRENDRHDGGPPRPACLSQLPRSIAASACRLISGPESLPQGVR